MAKPTKSSAKKPTARGAHPVAKKASKPTPGLHYSKEDLHSDYGTTYGWFMKALAIGILGALLYFFIMIIYLGAFGHTPTDDYVREFGSRIQYEYKGLRLPEYDDPSLLDKPAEKDAH